MKQIKLRLWYGLIKGFSLYLLVFFAPIQALDRLDDLTGPPGVPVGKQNNGSCCSPVSINDLVKIDNTIIVALAGPGGTNIADLYSEAYPVSAGLYVSKDNGVSWRGVTDLGERSPVFQQVQLKRSFYKLLLHGNRIYALSSYHIAPSITGSFAGLSGNGVYFSDDLGDTWQPVDPNYQLLDPHHDFSFSDIYVDEQYLYILYYNPNINTGTFNFAYKLPHTLDKVQKIRDFPFIRQINRFANGSFIGVGLDGLVVTDSNFDNPVVRLEVANTIRSVTVEGDYVAFIAGSLYESNDAGYSFIKSDMRFCQSGYPLTVNVTKGRVYVGHFCGTFFKEAIPGQENTFRQLPALDYYSRYNNGVVIDNDDIYVLDTRVHRVRLAPESVETLNPTPALAHITDLKWFNGALYVATKGSGVWRYAGGAWQQLDRGLQVQENTLISANLRGSEIFSLSIVASSEHAFLCANSTLGVHCLDPQRDTWFDVSTPNIRAHSTFAPAFQLERTSSSLAMFSALPDVLAIIRDGRSYFGIDTATVSELIQGAESKNISELMVAGRAMINPLARYQKTKVVQFQGRYFLKEGSMDHLGGYLSSRYFFTQGLFGMTVNGGFKVGDFSVSHQNLSSAFLNSDIQDLIPFADGFAAAVNDAGVYFSQDMQNWQPRNKFIGSLKVFSLGVFRQQLYAGTAAGLYRWRSESAEWELITGSEGWQISALLGTEDLLYIGTLKDGVKTYGPPPPRLLTVDLAGDGSGQVLSLPMGIDCPGQCLASFAEGQQVSIRVNPAPGSYVATWSLPCSFDQTPCEFNLNSELTVSITFSRFTYETSVSFSDGGRALLRNSLPVAHGDDLIFDVNPRPGFRVVRAVTSTCGIGEWLSRSTYKVASVVGNCSVEFKFEPIPVRRFPWWLLLESSSK